MFAIVKELFPQLKPSRFKSDYQKAAINAAKRSFPGITAEGDSFHFVQAIMKRVKSAGLMPLYMKSEANNDIEIYDQVWFIFVSPCLYIK